MNTPWVGIPDDYQDYTGFVYRITNKITEKAYIGRKYFFFKRGKALVESDWNTYLSSSKELQDDIKKLGLDNFEFLVLYVGKTKLDVNYMEVHLQIEADVLHKTLPNGEFAYYNKNILSKYFQPKDSSTPEYAEKCAKISEAIKRLYTNPEYTHPMKGKIHPNKGKKLPQTGHNLNKGKMWYTDGTVNLLLKSLASVPNGFVRGLSIRKKRICKEVELKRYLYNKDPKCCSVCGITLPYDKKQNKTCSKQCAKELQSRFSKENNTVLSLQKGLVKANLTRKENFNKGITCKRTLCILGVLMPLLCFTKHSKIPTPTVVDWYKKNPDITEYYRKYCSKRGVVPLESIPEEWLSD